MTTTTTTRPEALELRRLALRKQEAAQWLGISDESFDAYVRPHLPVVRLGSVRIYPIPAVLAWLDEQAAAPLDEIEPGRRR